VECGYTDSLFWPKNFNVKMAVMSDVTEILRKINQGDRAAAEQLLPLLYDELRKLAAAQLRRETSGQTLQATALVHEAYLRLVGTGAEEPRWDNRRHFFVAAAESMRRILVDNARRKRRLKHGGEFVRRPLGDLPEIDADCREDLLGLDEALTRLATVNSQAAELIQLRYFAGMTMKEVAAAMELPERTTARLWVYAKAWLLRELR
jgi:RNA polymerase sigma factor (TIGR02999 family)